MEPRDDQPSQHEFGNRTYVVAPVEPMDLDGIRTLQIGTLAWLVGFLALLPFYNSLADDGRAWWLWTCLTGFGFGLFGYEYCRRRKAARAARAEDEPGT